ncbi:hypothetical protein ABZ891_18290 [Streptomyces sp. NPDC047023]|uniref:hypothetical protein n=1 Tax=Streptomyces sp. NPDC047023 TaxID=3155139 RepID=UPI0033D9A65A
MRLSVKGVDALFTRWSAAARRGVAEGAQTLALTRTEGGSMDPNEYDPPKWWDRLKKVALQAGPWVALVANTITVLGGIQGK